MRVFHTTKTYFLVFTSGLIVTITTGLLDILFLASAVKWILLPISLVSISGTAILLITDRVGNGETKTFTSLVCQIVVAAFFAYVAFVSFKEAGEALMF